MTPLDAYISLVEEIDHTLTTGRRHYRTKAGRLMRTLDEVIRAILADDLMPQNDASAKPIQPGGGHWIFKDTPFRVYRQWHFVQPE